MIDRERNERGRKGENVTGDWNENSIMRLRHQLDDRWDVIYDAFIMNTCKLVLRLYNCISSVRWNTKRTAKYSQLYVKNQAWAAMLYKFKACRVKMDTGRFSFNYMSMDGHINILRFLIMSQNSNYLRKAIFFDPCMLRGTRFSLLFLHSGFLVVFCP